MRETCGRMTKRGTKCRLTLNGGKCPTHDVDLSKRNARVAKAFKKHDADGFRAQRSAAGKRGFAATWAMLGWEKANELAREWRIKHPSEPERWAIGVLEAAGLNHYEREYPCLGASAIDIAWPEQHMGIEVNGHQARPAFGETEPRAERHAAKVERLSAEGWNVLVVDATNDRAAGAQDIIAFARSAQPGNQD